VPLASSVIESDFERSLNDRGQRNAPRMGAAMNDRLGAVDAIVESPARRAITTATILAEALGCSVDAIRQESAIYEALLKTLLAVVRQIPDANESVLMVGTTQDFKPWLCALLGALVKHADLWCSESRFGRGLLARSGAGQRELIGVVVSRGLVS